MSHAGGGKSLDASLCQDLIGGKVARCEIVHDYLQIELDVATLNVFNPFHGLSPTPDGCRALLAQRVTNVEIRDDECMAITFSGGVRLEVSLRPDDYQGPEAVAIYFSAGGFLVL